MTDAEASFAESMSGAMSTTLSKKATKRAPELESIATKLAEERSWELSELQSIGHEIASVIEARAGTPFGKDTYTKEEKLALSAAVSATLEELQGQEIPFTAPVHGRLAKPLKEAIAVLPSGATALVVHPIYTETIRSNNRQYEGTHAAQAIVMKQAQTAVSTFGRSELQAGDFVFDEETISPQDYEGSLLGASMSRITRPAGPLQAGESPLDYLGYSKHIPKREEKFLQLIETGVLDGSGKLNPGQEEAFREQAPDFAAVVESKSLAEAYYAGKKPGGSIKPKKVANEVLVRKSNGEQELLKQPLYKMEEKAIDYQAHTIAAKTDWEGKPAPTVLAHEFAHAIQSRPGGIPGEKEIFQKLYPVGELQKGYGYKYYDSFPDEYMGHQGGRELFTRATEGLFYSTQADSEPYMLTDQKHGNEFRTWALGAWAVLAAKGAKQADQK